MTAEYPNASQYKDRHGVTRWRFRRNGKQRSLPGQPGDPDFERAYEDAAAGFGGKKTEIVPLPGASLPESFGAAWKGVVTTSAWKAHDAATKSKNTYLAEMWLHSQVAPGVAALWKDMPVRDMRRRHLKALISQYSDTPHKAKHLVVTIRKMLEYALDQEWIEIDPSYKLKHRPDYKGWRAWKVGEIEKFEERWPIGTTPRLAYSIALWLGNRREDVATLRWDQQCVRTIIQNGEARRVEGFTVEQGKGDGGELFLPISPMLAEVLDATERRGETVLVNAYGNPFSIKSMTGMMAHWTKMAGMGPGCTLHGLRKTLGKLMAEGGATTRQLMKVLGHENIEHAELYSREAEQALLATEGMDKVTTLMSGRKKRG
ncbi:tyrosine-type recombinase/integrase [Tianweitania sediminis]|uniref:Tyrosine-type recombinase/integrase n=1 Tax=Tianweitania sediminis TaxID=1502156 RepID=A0A8J7RRB9_9HYPH|nr:tyrosine-type recombinase/integrase [Tianweitania sediminis]MBP0440634.1 tyrosine-type recombinase/integrase [Tianweitania sediminis]